MKRVLILIFGISLVIYFAACFSSEKRAAATEVLQAYQADVARLKKEIRSLLDDVSTNKPAFEIQKQFKKARQAYKHIEWLAEYYHGYTAKHLNGPALAEVEPDEKNIIIQPEGFQVVEELLFPAYNSEDKEQVLQELRLLESNTTRLAKLATDLQVSDAHIFDALRLEVFRLITLGISGFDSPIAQNSISESAAVLKGIETVLSFYENRIDHKSKKLYDLNYETLEKGKAFLSTQKDFGSFNRLAFIVDYANPLSERLLELQQALGIATFTEPRALKPDASSLFAPNVFDADFYVANEEARTSHQKHILGKQLFYDTRLSGNGKRSCASCHQPEKAFTDGLVTNLSVDGQVKILRNTPTLINAALQPSLFYDTRISYLEDQAKEVIHDKNEMHGSLDEALVYIQNDSVYQHLFRSAYGNKDVAQWHIKNAIASYVRSLIALNSRFDQYMRGQHQALTKSEKSGFNLFMGKAKCGTCHFAPLFNSVNPPNFTKVDAEIIGVPADATNKQLDSDAGKYALYKIPLHRHAFKTPTVRNIALTAPYMHNGVFRTLEEVVDFYNNGGGVGHGFSLENQTLPSDSLHLSSAEKKDIIAFMKALTDTSVNQ